MNKRLVTLLMVISSTISAAETVVEIIPVYNRPASEIQPLLLPLLDTIDQIVPNGDNLIVKTTPERLTTLTNLIRKLDNPLKNLLISTIQSRDVSADQLNAGLEISVNVSQQHRGNFNGYAGGYYNQGNSHYDNQNIQTIRTLEGVTAHIKAGNAIPITQYQTYPNGYGYSNQAQSTQYIEATTGFEVTPRLTGQQVILDVYPWSDRLSTNGQIQTQEANTSIRANLGEWVEIGGIDEREQNNSSNTFAYHQRAEQNRLRILIKVDVVN